MNSALPLNEPSRLLRDIWRLIRSACRKWLFWKAYILISIVGLLALLLVEVPAFLEAIRIDQQRVAEILDQRRRIITGVLTRVLDHRERILTASSREEAGVLLGQVRDRNPSFPGIMAMGLLDSDASRPGTWGVVMEGVRGAGLGLLEIAKDPVVAATLDVVGRTRSPRITPLFHPKGAADTNQVLVALLSPVSPSSRGWQVPPGGVFLIIADVRQWAQEANIPASLRILGCFLGNEPDNGVVVDVDGQMDDSGPPPMGRVGIELDPEHRGLLATGVPELPMFTPRPATKTGNVRPPSSAIQAVIQIEDFGDSRFRCYVGPSPALYASRSRLAVLRSFPIRAARVLFFGFLLSVIWTVFQADRQQMRQLNEAQQTIQRLDLHRTLIQQELHDHIIQNLTLLGIRLAAAHPASPEGFQKFRETTLAQLDYLRGELRRLLRQGTERVDSFNEMILQVQSICRRMEEQSGARCQVTSANPSGIEPTPEILFRTCRFIQELVGNAIRHGVAKNIRVHVEAHMVEALLVVRVTDDGKGFDPATCAVGFGLQSMGAFARKSKGTLEFQRVSPRGMAVELRMPLGLTQVRL